MSSLFEVEDLRTQFFTPTGIVKAVDGISYTVDEGETVAIVGESGCGKSVSALSILGLIPEPAGKIAGGSIRFMGTDLLKLSAEEMRRMHERQFTMIFQEPKTSTAFTILVAVKNCVRRSSTFSKPDNCIYPISQVLVRNFK